MGTKTAPALKFKKLLVRDFPRGQWLRLHAPDAGGPGLIPGQGTRSRMLQLKILHVATKIPHAAPKDPKQQNK